MESRTPGQRFTDLLAGFSVIAFFILFHTLPLHNLHKIKDKGDFMIAILGPPFLFILCVVRFFKKRKVGTLFTFYMFPELEEKMRSGYYDEEDKKRDRVILFFVGWAFLLMILSLTGFSTEELITYEAALGSWEWLLIVIAMALGALIGFFRNRGRLHSSERFLPMIIYALMFWWTFNEAAMLTDLFWHHPEIFKLPHGIRN